MSAVDHGPTTTTHTGFIDNSPLTSFHKKLTLFSSGGPFIDGYVISIIGFSWASMGTSMDITSSDKGLIAAAIMVGIFIGGLVFGWLTDKIGRHIMYIADLLALALLSIVSFFATDVWQLILLRFLVGMAIGADYPIATSLLAEYLPSKFRGRMLGATFVVWAIGAAVAPVVGMICTALAGDDAWRWMLASPALFALLTLGLRLGTPESPRWLVSQGRIEEANASIRKAFGPGYDVTSLGEPEPENKASLKTLFQGLYLKRTLFVSVFWMCQVIPMLSIYSFSFDILEEVGLTGNGAEIFLAAMFVLGGIPGLLLVDRIGRKPLLVWTFAIVAVVWGAVGVIQSSPVALVFAAICAFAFFNGAANFLQIVYPNELFPTEVRATAVGVGTAVSRIGAAIATYAMPFALDAGISWVLIVGAIFSLLGLGATLAWGEETNGQSLSSSANRIPVAQPVA